MRKPMYTIDKLLKMDEILTIGVHSSTGALRMPYNGHDMLGGKVRHTSIRSYWNLARKTAQGWLESL